MLERMIDKRPQADRILVAAIWGQARHRARWRELSSDEKPPRWPRWPSSPPGRAHLLAKVAGILEGAAAGEHG